MIPNRIVLDTNVCLDLFVFNDPRSAALEAVLQSASVQAVTREDCRNEWLLVLAYPQFALDLQQVLRAKTLTVTTRYNVRGGFETSCSVTLPATAS